MAEDRVNIVFGATVGEALAGIAGVKEAIEGFTGPLKKLQDNLQEIGDAFVAAFAIEKIKEAVEAMAELGEKTLNAAYMLGQSVEDYAQLSGALRLVGVDSDTAQKTMERLGHQVQGALVDPAGKAATGFKNLHISMEEVRRDGQNLTTMLSLVIERYQELAPTLQNTGALMDVLGLRGGDKLAGAMRAGAEGFKEALESAKEYAVAMNAAAPAMDNTAEGIHKLGLDLDTLKADGFLSLKPTIDAVVSGLDDLVKGLNAAIGPIGDLNREMSTWEVVFRVIRVTISDVINAFAALKDTLTYIVDALKAFADQAAQIFIGVVAMMKNALTGGSVEAAYDQMLGRLEAITISRGNELAEIWQGIANRIESIMSGGASDRTPFEAMGSARGYLSFGASRGGGAAGTEKAGKGKTAKEKDPNEGEWTSFEPKKEEEELTRLQKIDDERFARRKAQIEADTTFGIMNVQKSIQSQRQLLDEQWANTQQYYDKKRKIMEDDYFETRKLNDQEASDYEKLLTQKQALDNQSRGALKSDLENLIAPIKSALASSATGVAMGTQTLGQAGANIGKAILGEVINKTVGTLFDKLIAQTIENLFKQLAEDAANTGILGGWLALLVAKPSVAGTTYQYGGIVSAQGGWHVPSNSLAQLHAGEMVLPKHISDGMQNMIKNGGGGGGSANIHIHAWDTQTGHEALMKNAGSIGSALRTGGMYGNWSPRMMSAGGNL